MYEYYVYDSKYKNGDYGNISEYPTFFNVDLSIYRICTMALRNKLLKKNNNT
jgi:hypothetical protein